MPFHLLNAATALLLLMALASSLNAASDRYPYGGEQATQQQQYQPGTGPYSNYGQFTGKRPDGNPQASPMDYRVEEGGGTRRRANTRRLSLEERPSMPAKKLDSAMFRDQEWCAEKCEFECQIQLFFGKRDEDQPGEEMFYCAKLRPPPRAFHQKIADGFGRAGVFEFIVAGVVLFAVLLCVLCSCYQCCCRRPIGRRARGRSFGSGEPEQQGGHGKATAGVHSLNGGGTLSSSGLSPEHESLTINNHLHMDDGGGIQPAPLPVKAALGMNNGGLQGHQQHHHQQFCVMPRSTTGGGFSTGSREQSIV